MYIFLSVVLTGILFFIYIFVEPHWLKTKHLTISSNNVPASFSGSKIVFISDIHYGENFSQKRVEKLVDKINSLQPDIILLGGDYVNSIDYIQSAFDELKNLSAKYGVFGVLGNHDHWEDAALISKLMIKYNFNVCDNRSYWINIGNEKIKIGGVGDLWEDTQDIDSVTNDVNPNDFCILLSHNPDFVENINTNLIDLSLSGHTHGGQVTFFGLWAPFIPSKYGQKYRYGLINRDDSFHYTTSGVGTITPAVRFFCRPEIVVIELRSE